MGADDNDGAFGVDIDSGLLQPTESLEARGLGDALDEGYSPPDHPWALNPSFGPEGLARRLSREVPEVMIGPAETAGSAGSAGELYDDEVGTRRAGRLAEYEGSFDDYQYLYAVDVGVDGGSASAEEAAVHLVLDPDEQ
ncbi:DUF5709 domain-containing protein [Actinomycetospora callitridis]|uniref:DUF5709 domain-containing protein n=1 Tax=Actinomycetospora callitridis TaxID=913944 RepID=UPI0023659980|nr:DUF5709 domain-containing protein [Actinomycetospora callitridis]MDD7920179.1 DUF5709 domain-containing protein [Actinomycetospora callitridis]